MATPEEMAQAALEATPLGTLLTKAYQLTRRMQIEKDSPHVDDLRAMRDLITDEVLRRTTPTCYLCGGLAAQPNVCDNHH